MAELSEENQRLTLKIVYYGPALSGKTTNIMKLHELLQPELKGDMMVLDTQNDRTLFFDLFPLGFRTKSGLTIKCKLYTVPGQVQHDSTRKALLSRTDGIVFIADSSRTQDSNNGESFDNLATNLNRLGKNIENEAVVIQFNKRDLDDIYPEEELNTRWQATPWMPLQFSSAINGSGVIETFRQLLTRIYPLLEDEFSLASLHGLDVEAFTSGLSGYSVNAMGGLIRDRRL